MTVELVFSERTCSRAAIGIKRVRMRLGFQVYTLIRHDVFEIVFRQTSRDEYKKFSIYNYTVYDQVTKPTNEKYIFQLF